jgi:hypothetical protein
MIEIEVFNKADAIIHFIITLGACIAFGKWQKSVWAGLFLFFIVGYIIKFKFLY